MTTDATDRLLIAGPGLWDPNFRRTVVYVHEHDEFGALGLVLNDPTDIPATGLIEHWDHLLLEPQVVFRGGPVSLETAIGLSPGHDGQPLIVDLESPSAGESGVRIFAGYSGWGPGQLDAELAEDAWIVVHRAPGEVFTADPAALWEHVTSRVPRVGPLLKSMPDNPTLN